MRILLVGERFDCGSIIAQWLNEFFAAVFVESAASDGEALDAIARSRPELVLAAHLMPLVNGIELARAIKALANPPALVVIDAGSDAELERRCAAAGADFCVEKRQLQARLLAFLQHRRFPRTWAEGVAARSMASMAARGAEHRA